MSNKNAKILFQILCDLVLANELVIYYIVKLKLKLMITFDRQVSIFCRIQIIQLKFTYILNKY